MDAGIHIPTNPGTFFQSRLIQYNIQSDLFSPNTHQHHVKLIQDPRPCPIDPTPRALISISSMGSISIKILYTLKRPQASRKTALLHTRTQLSLSLSRPPRARGHRFILHDHLLSLPPFLAHPERSSPRFCSLIRGERGDPSSVCTLSSSQFFAYYLSASQFNMLPSLRSQPSPLPPGSVRGGDQDVCNHPVSPERPEISVRPSAQAGPPSTDHLRILDILSGP